ncbi:MAG: hypothetical protein LBU18_02735, partial [Treponema sp.]|nr:hypothetical protein [Treponema sp.]
MTCVAGQKLPSKRLCRLQESWYEKRKFWRKSRACGIGPLPGMGGGGCRKITSSPAGDPALEGKVSISEEATVGAELSVDTTQLEGTGTITYQWESGETA